MDDFLVPGSTDWINCVVPLEYRELFFKYWFSTVTCCSFTMQCKRSAQCSRVKDEGQAERKGSPNLLGLLRIYCEEIMKKNTFDLSWPNETKDRAAAALCLCSTDRDSAGWAGSQQLRELETSVATADRSNMDPVGPYWPLTPEHCDKLMFWAGRIFERKEMKKYQPQQSTNLMNQSNSELNQTKMSNV